MATPQSYDSTPTPFSKAALKIFFTGLHHVSKKAKAIFHHEIAAAGRAWASPPVTPQPGTDDLITGVCLCEVVPGGVRKLVSLSDLPLPGNPRFHTSSEDAPLADLGLGPRFAESSENSQLYYSLDDWPDRHPTQGLCTALIDRLGLDLATIVEEEADKHPILSDSDAAFLPHVRLAGYVCYEHSVSVMRPTIWVDCGSDRVRHVVNRALHRESTLRWLQFDTVFVQKALNLAAGFLGPNPEMLNFDQGLDIGHSRKLHLHRAKSGCSPICQCGIRICATVTRKGVVCDSRVSTMGGVLELNRAPNTSFPVDKATAVTGDGASVLYGCSTAHGILDMLFEAGFGTDNGVNFSDPIDMRAPGIATTDESGNEWLPIPGPIVLDYVRTAAMVQDKLQMRSSNPRPHDFALFDSETAHPAASRSSCPNVIGRWDDCYLSRNKLHVEVCNGVHQAGIIIPREETLFIRKSRFKTRRLVLSSPLCPGDSGSWIVADFLLCGVVMSRYEREPLAHIITAEKLVQDISETMDISKTSVTFPGYVRPIRSSRSMHPNPSSELSGLFYEWVSWLNTAMTQSRQPPQLVAKEHPIGDLNGEKVWLFEPDGLTERLKKMQVILSRLWHGTVYVRIFLVGASSRTAEVRHLFSLDRCLVMPQELRDALVGSSLPDAVVGYY